MFFILILFCLSLNIFGFPSHQRDDTVLDYYWRDYLGVIPADALPGGTDKLGHPTYIGQAYFKDYGLMVSSIYAGKEEAKSSYGKEISTKDYVKILCAEYPEKYQWHPVKIEEMHLLTDCHVVLGGVQQGSPLKIGRANHDSETVIGKVFDSKSPVKGLWIHSPTGHVNFLTFELLVYNCDLHKTRAVEETATDLNRTIVHK